MNRWASQYILNTSRSLSFSSGFISSTRFVIGIEGAEWRLSMLLLASVDFAWEYWVSPCCIITTWYWSILSCKGRVDEELISFMYRWHFRLHGVLWHGFSADADPTVFELPIRVKLLYFKHLFVTWTELGSSLLRVRCFLSANPWSYRMVEGLATTGSYHALAHRACTFKKQHIGVIGPTCHSLVQFRVTITISCHVSKLTKLLQFLVLKGSFLFKEWDACAILPIFVPLGLISSRYWSTEALICLTKVKGCQCTHRLALRLFRLVTFSKEWWRFNKASSLLSRNASPGCLRIQIVVDYSLPTFLIFTKGDSCHGSLG